MQSSVRGSDVRPPGGVLLVAHRNGETGVADPHDPPANRVDAGIIRQLPRGQPGAVDHDVHAAGRLGRFGQRVDPAVLEPAAELADPRDQPRQMRRHLDQRHGEPQTVSIPRRQLGRRRRAHTAHRGRPVRRAAARGRARATPASPTPGTPASACSASAAKVSLPQRRTRSGGPTWVGNQTAAASADVVAALGAAATTRTW